jgi:hypothetical protein
MVKNFFTVKSLRGGLNNSDPAISIPDDQCVEALNVEFVRSMLGERRRGTSAVTLPANISGEDRCSFLFRHVPGQDHTAAELWAGGFTAAGSFKLSRKTTSWSDITISDTPLITGFAPYEWQAASLHGKIFLAFDSDADRLHVVDSGTTTMRRVGIAAPVAPTSADTGSGTFSGVRYYRVRMTVQDSGVTLRRSEPGAVLTDTPSGTGTGIIVTKPATVESATHWELEASKDNVNFYVIATTAVGTTTVTDSQDYDTGYAQDFDLSEDTGDYSLPWSARFIVPDEDRLVFAGSWEDDDFAATVGWTPVGQANGSGNDERYEADTDPLIDLDGLDGGPLTGMSSATAGEIWCFKFSRIYKLVRSGLRTRAYDTVKMHDAMGALKGSVVNGRDPKGRPCVYFLDPSVGPCRAGAGAIMQCGEDIRETWALLNLEAAKVVCKGLFYPKNRQIIWNIATGSSDTPTLSIVVHVNEMRESEQGFRRGWTTWDGVRTQGLAMCLFSSNIEDDAARDHDLVPFIGGEFTGRVHLCDTGADDNGTAYAASIKTKPYILKTLATKFGVLTAYLLAKANTNASVVVKLIRDFGVETPTTTGTQTMTPAGSETNVIKVLDELVGSELRTVQFQFLDPGTPGTDRFELNQLALIENQQQQQ